ncbi:MAG: LLM class flavin-dependent oxidoreductase [Chloroflexota bacterium]
MQQSRMKFGIFLAPFHPLGENPTLAIHRDLELIERLDELGYDEAWVGEHHSAGWETIASPEVFIAAASQRTRHIKLGTGVVSLPYHHPLLVADRMVLLDHLTRGRVLFGVGPGALVSDAIMLGIDPPSQRPRMEEAMGVIMRLFTELDPIDYECEWFTLRGARLQLRPYTQPHMPIAVAAVQSPSGMVTAGKFGAGVLTFSVARGDNAPSLQEFWGIAEKTAAEHGKTMDRREWRIVLPLHLAESRAEAMAQIRERAGRYQAEYRRATLSLELDVDAPPERLAEEMVARDAWCVGTPDDLVAKIRAFQESSGGFGELMVQAIDWADREHLLHSYELLARYVMPHFQGSLDGLVASQATVADQSRGLNELRLASLARARSDYEQRQRG